ncbi:MAG: peptidylprolyl isomerase [Alphaproteobacteria bacterium]|nr:peptidylprolyl isomerase [Alphaproteobacteria bacterium]
MRKSIGLCFALSLLALGAARAADDPKDWRQVDPDNLVLIQTKYGVTAVELKPEFAPRHVERMKALIRAHFFDGLTFYRVIEGFVAQGGAGEDTAATANKPKNPETEKAWPKLRAEFERPIPRGERFTPLGNADLFAPRAGHVDGFAVGRDPKTKTEWLIHCPGTFAFARDNDADTATTEFYIVIGQAPRRLDRNLSAFGRVVGGMEYLQKLERGDPAVDSGVIADKAKQDKIVSIKLASDMPAAERPSYAVMRTDTRAFADWKAKRRNPAPEFYKRQPPPVLDICLAPVPSHEVTN